MYIGKEANNFNIKLKNNKIESKSNKLTKNMIKGILGEKLVNHCLKKLSIPIDHQDWEAYEYGEGVDLWNKKIGLYIEVKNLSGHYYVDSDFVKNKIVARFPKNAKYKILIISHSKALKAQGRELLKENNIRLVEYGQQVLGKNKKAAHNLIRNLYWLYYRLKDIIRRVYPCSISSNTNTYVDYTSTCINMILNKYSKINGIKSKLYRSKSNIGIEDSIDIGLYNICE